MEGAGVNGRRSQQRAERRAALGTAQRDQLDASEAETRNLALRMGAVGGLTPAGVSNPGSRLALRLDLLEDGLAAGALELCPHLLAAPSPRVVCTALWVNLLYCSPPCAPPEPVGRERYTCDCCGTYDRGLVPGLLALGSVLVALGVCRNCYSEAVN